MLQLTEDGYVFKSKNGIDEANAKVKRVEE